MLDLDGHEQQRRTIFVNSPLRWAAWTPFVLCPGQPSCSARSSCACSVSAYLSGRRPVSGCRYNGVTAYQTDWAIAAVTLRAEGSPLEPKDHTAFNLPMASLQGQPGGQNSCT